MKTLLELDSIEARKYFLKKNSYVNFDLPPYFNFEPLLKKVSRIINKKSLDEFLKNYDTTLKKRKKPFPADFDNTNYRIYINKDGNYAWRPFQIIHPALYVSLVHKITEKNNWKFIIKRFSEFQKNTKISCQSIPIESTDTDISDKATTISNWWQTVEQKSIELALRYEYIMHTDITDCYSSIYTHTIPWAIHTKEEAKKKRNDKSLIGNSIDRHLMDMSNGQTNGIPQGSTLMDFIAEMVLGYVDLELTKKIEEHKTNP